MPLALGFVPVTGGLPKLAKIPIGAGVMCLDCILAANARPCGAVIGGLRNDGLTQPRVYETLAQLRRLGVSLKCIAFWQQISDFLAGNYTF